MKGDTTICDPIRNKDGNHVMLNLCRESQGYTDSLISQGYETWTI
jgi:hypothetical protein